MKRVRYWAKLPAAGDRTRTRRRDRCSDTSINSVTLARTTFGQIPSLSNVGFRVARFAGGMARFGRKRNGRDGMKLAVSDDSVGFFDLPGLSGKVRKLEVITCETKPW